MTACVARPNAQNSIDLVIIAWIVATGPLSVILVPSLRIVIVPQRWPILASCIPEWRPTTISAVLWVSRPSQIEI